MHDPARPGFRREGTRPRVRGAPPAPPAGGELPAVARSVERAAELLDVINEAELEGLLGRLVAETARNAGGRLPADTGRALVAVLRRTAERTLPTLATALGDQPEPTGGAGPSAADTAARVYGLELEGMSAEDRDFEIARQFLRFAEATTARAARAPAQAPAAAAVDAAVTGAGRELAPGLVPPQRSSATVPQPGPWARRRADVGRIGVPPPSS
jgi:hypothetical protein